MRQANKQMTHVGRACSNYSSVLMCGQLAASPRVSFFFSHLLEERCSAAQTSPSCQKVSVIFVIEGVFVMCRPIGTTLRVWVLCVGE